MTITSSTLIEDSPQIDGRRWIGERHVDHLGAEHLVRYLGDAATNAPSVMAARVAGIVADLRAGEVGANLSAVLDDGRNAAMTFNHSGPVHNFAQLRAAYAGMSRRDAVFLGDFLASLSDAQLQTAFGMTLPQVTTLRVNKLVPAANAAATIRANSGA